MRCDTKKSAALVFYDAWLRPAVGEYISLPYREQILSWSTPDRQQALLENGMRYVSEVLQQSALQAFQ